MKRKAKHEKFLADGWEQVIATVPVHGDAVVMRCESCGKSYHIKHMTFGTDGKARCVKCRKNRDVLGMR